MGSFTYLVIFLHKPVLFFGGFPLDIILQNGLLSVFFKHKFLNSGKRFETHWGKWLRRTANFKILYFLPSVLPKGGRRYLYEIAV